MTTKPDDKSWSTAAIAGAAAIGSAALAAALLYASRRRESPNSPPALPPHPENAPETD